MTKDRTSVTKKPGTNASPGGAGEPATPGKGSERPLNDDQPLRPGDSVESIDRERPARRRPESPGGAGDIERIE